jgi:hypothetical protein
VKQVPFVVGSLTLWLVLVPAVVRGQETVRDAARTLFSGSVTATEIDAVATVFALQISTVPVGTSSGGFTYRFNRQTGALELKTQSFGPLFAERASTLGSQGTFSLGVNAQATRFVSFEGRNLRNGDLRSRIAAGNEILDVHRFTFNVGTQTTVLSASLAADDNIDVGVIVPLVRTSLNGTMTALLPTGQRTEIADASGSSVGDIVARGKWNFLDRPRYGLAAMLEIVLPTGSEEQLASTGHLRVRPVFVASAESGGFSPHANLGVTFGGDGVRVRDDGVFFPVIEQAEPGYEVNYAVGADVTPTGPLTLFADIIGRSLQSVARFEGGQRLRHVPEFGTTLAIEGFVAREGTLHVRLGAIGGRTIVFGRGLLSAAVLFPLNDEGLQPGLTPVVGFDYTF